jgi:hypothetical protein
MGLYSASELELLFQHVVRDNPELTGRISTDSIRVRSVPAKTTKNGRNTVITMVGKPGKGFSEECTVYYNGPLNSNTVADVTTATNSFANKAYGRAVSQTDVEAAGVKGMAYFTITAKNRPFGAYFIF